MPQHRCAACALLLALAAACDDPPQPLQVDAPGAVSGLVYLDRDGDGKLGGPDLAFAGAEVVLAAPGLGGDAARDTSDAEGKYVLEAPVGRYRVRLGAGLGDSVHLGGPVDTVVTVSVSAVPSVVVGVTYPRHTVASARALPAGRRVFVDGIVTAVFGDTVHVESGGRALRAARVLAGGPVNGAELPGDSVRLLGRTASIGGQPALDGTTLFPLAANPTPAPADVRSGEAAAGGAWDAARVRVDSATIVDTVTVAGESLLRVDDGSGPLEVRLGAGVRFGLTAYVPGAVLTVAGTLVPSAEGVWRLRPAGLADLLVTGAESPFRPRAPADVTATAADSLVTVAWADSSGNETEFRIERLGDTGGWRLLATVPAETGERVDTAAANSLYRYRVRACNGLVCSAPSAEAQAATVPAAPTSLAAQARSRAALLNWRDAARVEDEYQVERREGAGAFGAARSLPPNTQSLLDAGLPPGTEQTWRVRACNAAGCSAWSNEAMATILP
jgi:hypothetical protein